MNFHPPHPQKPGPRRQPQPSGSRPTSSPRPGTHASSTPKAHPDSSPQVTHWHNVTDWYDELVGAEGSEYQRAVILPGVLRMLEASEPSPPTVTSGPLRILDLACGQGVMCRALAEHYRPPPRPTPGRLVRPVQILGVDAAPGLIAAAETRNQTDRLPIQYVVGDATKLTEVPALKPFLAEPGGTGGGRLDAITCILAIQNMTPLSPIWEACAKLLKPGGRLILVMMHPCYRIPKTSGWGWDDKTRLQYRRIETYLTSSKTPIQMHPGADPTAQTVTFHRPLQAYINTLGSQGLLLDHIEEWASHKQSQPGPKQAALDQSRKEIPLFLALRARRV